MSRLSPIYTVLVVVLVLVLCIIHTGDAHTRMKYPTPRNDNPGLKTEPCGGVEYTVDQVVTTFQAGQEVVLSFEETINHPGWFRLAFSKGGDAGFEEYIFRDYIKHNSSVPAPRIYTVPVIIPNVQCKPEDRCSIQVIQVMTDKPKINGRFQNYYSCSNVVIEQQSALISAFNVQVFGQSKMDKPGVPGNLTQIIRWYDMLLFQEIRDSSGTAITELFAMVNGNTSLMQAEPYMMTVGERLGRTNSKEQYAILYRPSRYRLVKAWTYNDTANDNFEREPLIATFDTILPTGLQGNSFHVIGCHIAPDDAVKELEHLVEVYDSVIVETGLDNAVIMGDFNAECSYVNKGELENVTLFKDPRFLSLIPDSADTTVSKTDCAYDRIVIAGASLRDQVVPNSGRVVRYDLTAGLDEDEAKVISDHYPVEFRLTLPRSPVTTPTPTPSTPVTPTSTPAPGVDPCADAPVCASTRYRVPETCACACPHPFQSGATCTLSRVGLLVPASLVRAPVSGTRVKVLQQQGQGLDATSFVTDIATLLNLPATSLTPEGRARVVGVGGNDALVNILAGTPEIAEEIVGSTAVRMTMQVKQVFAGNTTACEERFIDAAIAAPACSVQLSGQGNATCFNGACHTVSQAKQEYPSTATTGPATPPASTPGAITTTPTPTPNGGGGGGGGDNDTGIIVGIILGTVVIVGLAFGAAFWIRRKNSGGGSTSSVGGLSGQEMQPHTPRRAAPPIPARAIQV